MTELERTGMEVERVKCFNLGRGEKSFTRTIATYITVPSTSIFITNDTYVYLRPVAHFLDNNLLASKWILHTSENNKPTAFHKYSIL